jgi:ribosomal protein S24E
METKIQPTLYLHSKAKKGVLFLLLQNGCDIMSSQEAEYQISFIEEKVNPLMERREVKIEVASKSTPKRDLLRKAVASSLKVPIEQVFVKSSLSSFGTNVSICRLHIYNDAKRAKQIEQKYIQLRNLSRDERKQSLGSQASKAAEQKPAEATKGQKVK